jgi:hypothetical protein
MKLANSREGREIEAAEDAPNEAICRYCGGEVVLRGRRLMGSKLKSYYWRHLDNQNRSCPGRVRSAR